METQELALYQEMPARLPVPGYEDTYTRNSAEAAPAYLGPVNAVVILSLAALVAFALWKCLYKRYYFLTAGVSLLGIAAVGFLYFEFLIPRRFLYNNSITLGNLNSFEVFLFLAPIMTVVSLVLIGIGLIRLEIKQSKSEVKPL